ncbi:hypothetical protein [Lysobacter enzymogenes]|uniref:hypothetical protein n=1 Tax=Lysobacter enzymogenes TaxID=69 RepID=UPI00089B1BEA|nr:hypothetical protein [Lysobacter enzymogenes]SDY17851.1 hypothetical protein SAMN05421681_1134 [Lysobacter enzymogenes]
MHPIRRRLTLFAAAFVFAAGFAGTAVAGSCWDCLQIYNDCMNEPGTTQSRCAHRHNLCAQPMNCPLMPESEIE